MRSTAIPALCALTLCGACAGERGESAAAPVAVPVSELPARHREVLAAYGAGGELWERTREEVRGDPVLGPFVIENLVLEMVRAHDALGSSDGARARAALDRSRAELARLAPQSVPTLVELWRLGSDGFAARGAAASAYFANPDFTVARATWPSKSLEDAVSVAARQWLTPDTARFAEARSKGPPAGRATAANGDATSGESDPTISAGNPTSSAAPVSKISGGPISTPTGGATFCRSITSGAVTTVRIRPCRLGPIDHR